MPVLARLVYRVSPPFFCPSLWERCPSAARTERVNAAKPSQSPSVTALPEGEPSCPRSGLGLSLREGAERLLYAEAAQEGELLPAGVFSVE